MNPRTNPVAVILGVGCLTLAVMIIREGGIAQAWENNNGGIVIAALVVVGLAIRAWTKRSKPAGVTNQDRS